jgi:chromosomal replication initiation ATPase DnaA
MENLILREVSTTLNVPQDAILSKDKNRSAYHARAVCIYLMHLLSPAMSQTEIGSEFGVSRFSACRAIKSQRGYCDIYDEEKNLVGQLRDKLSRSISRIHEQAHKNIAG